MSEQPQPRGEGDDLAARTVKIIRNRAKIAREQGTTEAQIIRARALDEAANEFADILPALRASTHPEQWVSGDDREWLLWITSYVLNRHEFTDSAATDARAALTRIATAIKQPASPTPTEQGEDRSIRGCSPSSTRTPPTNAGRRGLAGSTDTNAPRGSCSNEPMPR